MTLPNFQTNKSQYEVLPEIYLLRHWNESEILSYTVFKSEKRVSREHMLQMVRDAMMDLERRCGLNNELRYAIRIEGGHVRYLNSTVRDPNIPQAHAHVLMGKHKLTNSNKHPERDWEWYDTNLKEIWPHAPRVFNEPYKINAAGTLTMGAYFYNLKAPQGCTHPSWDDPVAFSRMLRRHLFSVERKQRLFNSAGNAIYEYAAS